MTPYERGYQAGTCGESRGACRERGPFAREEWKRGYEDAKELLAQNLTLDDEIKLLHERKRHAAA